MKRKTVKRPILVLTCEMRKALREKFKRSGNNITEIINFYINSPAAREIRGEALRMGAKVYYKEEFVGDDE